MFLLNLQKQSRTSNSPGQLPCNQDQPILGQEDTTPWEARGMWGRLDLGFGPPSTHTPNSCPPYGGYGVMPALTPPNQTPFKRLLELHGVSRCPSVPAMSHLPLIQWSLGAHILAISLTTEPSLTHAPSLQEMQRQTWGSHRGNSLSAVSFECHLLVMMLNTSITLCALKISFQAVIVWQTPLLIKMH